MSEVELQDQILKHSLELMRLSAGEQRKAETILRELEHELKLLLMSRELSAASKAEIRALIAEAEAVINPAYATAAKALDTHALALIVAERTVEVLEDVIPANVLMPSQEVLASLTKDVLIDGAPSSAWWEKQGEDTAFRFAAQVRQGVINGETNERIVGRVRDLFGAPRAPGQLIRNARALVHSSVMSAANDARLATFRKNGRLIAGVRWLATLDHHSCVICAALDGQAWDLEGAKLTGTKVDFRSPPAHWNCLPGDALVLARGSISGATKRGFDGKVCVIRTTSGRNLTATPNHPILTNRGWVAIGLLDVGDNVVCDSGREWVGDAQIDGENVPACIHDVAESFLGPRDMFAVPMEFAAEDFHGDGADGKVGVVWADGLLRDERHASLFEHPRELAFIGGRAGRLPELAGDGGLAEPVEAGGLAALEPSPALGHSGALFGCCPRHANELLFAPIAEGDPLILEAGDDGRARHAEPLSNAKDADALIVELDRLAQIEGDTRPDAPSEDARAAQSAGDEARCHAESFGDLDVRFPGQVFFDQIVSVDRKAFHGDVFNLETSGGWYVAEGIVTHNCRCVLSPIPKSFRDIGLNIDEPTDEGTRASSLGPVAGGTTFAEFFGRLSAAQQDKQFGPTRAALFRAGRITIKDLVSGTGRELTLEELRP